MKYSEEHSFNMKKTLQIITVPSHKEGWDKNDLLKLISGKSFDECDWVLAGRENDNMVEGNWQAQQLLVLSDDEIQEGDWFGHTEMKKLYRAGIVSKLSNDVECTIHDCYIPIRYARKVIASYPQLEGTLPISKETVQSWINAGTPGEGSVDKQEWSTVLNDPITITHLVKNNWKLVKSELPEPPFDDALMYYYERDKLDTKNNLLLEFEQQTLETAARDAAKSGGPFSTHGQNYEYMFKLGAEWQKQQLKP